MKRYNITARRTALASLLAMALPLSGCGSEDAAGENKDGSSENPGQGGADSNGDDSSRTDDDSSRWDEALFGEGRWSD